MLSSTDDSFVINLAFGQGTIPLHADPKLADWHVIRPQFESALPDAEAVFHASCHSPIGCPPLWDVVQASDRVVIVTSDGTRPVPNHKLIPWLLEELPVSSDKVTVLLGNGSHRSNSPVEITAMFGEDVAKRVEIVNHDAFDPKQNTLVAKTARGTSIYLDQRYVEADKRILVGFIEPHMFAGFSGGAKAMFPGIAGIETILHLHRAELIADPLSTWGTLEDNPIRQEIAAMARYCPPDFMVNVTLNTNKEITGFFIGHYEEAHKQGCARVKEVSMVAVPHTFPIVVTSNSGYPLDQNLYQTVKGISAACRIVEPGGTIFVASECCDGIPAHGNFAELMRIGFSAEDILRWIFALDHTILDQWEAQVLAEILKKAEVALYSKMDRESVEACKLQAVNDFQSGLQEKIQALRRGAKVAVLPDGPLTIPYVLSVGEGHKDVRRNP